VNPAGVTGQGSSHRQTKSILTKRLGDAFESEGLRCVPVHKGHFAAYHA